MVWFQHADFAKSSLYKFLAATYTILLGFVLPFICWGALATPGHPHRMAHFVFMTPPMHAEVVVKDHKIDHSADQQEARTDANDQPETAAQPVGRSLPPELTSAITILSPLLLVLILLVFRPAHLRLRLSHTSTSHLFDPRVLTPPPRRLYL
ncbi:MAG: hypothetical protein IT328_18050 [Caldilineaceae bacterium]|nr:hypothetical protein [Caldilineaceae bacterium]